MFVLISNYEQYNFFNLDNIKIQNGIFKLRHIKKALVKS